MSLSYVNSGETKADSISEDRKLERALLAVDHPVFVIGTMRSGTGFMGLRLNEVPQFIGCPFELRHIWHNTGKVNMAWDVDGVDCPHLNGAYAESVKIEALKMAFAQEIINNMHGRVWSDNLRFLSKNPHLCNKIDLVSTLFPDAQYVWTIRNMHDVVTSLKNLFGRKDMIKKEVQHIWPARKVEDEFRCFSVNRNARKSPSFGENVFPGGRISLLAEYWLESNLSMLNHFERADHTRFTVVSHDEMMRNPESITYKLRAKFHLSEEDFANLGSKLEPSGIRQWDSELEVQELEELKEFEHQNRLQIDRILSFIGLH